MSERLQRRTDRLLLGMSVLIVALAAGCGSAIIPELEPVAVSESAELLLERSLEAHGGAEAWEEVDDVSVRYSGEWLSRIVVRLQPVLSDTAYRTSSEERYLFDEGVVAQSHEGRDGRKYVLRTPDGVDVWYDGTPAQDEEVLAAAALVADAYEMFLTGPRFFAERGATLSALGSRTVDGEPRVALLAIVRPGFGFSEEDRAVLYLNPETSILERVRFTLNGVESTRGAEVEVRFGEHREVGGILWPTHFYERVESPVSLAAHEWWLEDIDLNRGIEPGSLAGPELSGDAATAAGATGR